MVNISTEAATKLKSLISESHADTRPESVYVRVSVASGGCSGLSYKLDFDTEKYDTDKEFEAHGVTVVVNKQSYLYLVGTTLEYSGGLNGKGFVFSNPNATRTCGCGESFAV